MAQSSAARGAHLPDQVARLLLRHGPAAVDEVEQVAARHVLHDEEDVIVSLNDGMQLDHVWVAQHLEDADLPARQCGRAGAEEHAGAR
jgi:hypothetical protein